MKCIVKADFCVCVDQRIPFVQKISSPQIILIIFFSFKSKFPLSPGNPFPPHLVSLKTEKVPRNRASKSLSLSHQNFFIFYTGSSSDLQQLTAGLSYLFVCPMIIKTTSIVQLWQGPNKAVGCCFAVRHSNTSTHRESWSPLTRA